MTPVRIVASYDEDETQKIVIVGFLTNDGHLKPGAEAFGYVVDWDEDSNCNLRYPFVLEPVDENNAMLSWGGFDSTPTSINVMGRRLVTGEKIVRRESGESSHYTVRSVVAN